MCSLYLKLRVFFLKKVQSKSVLKGIVSFMYNINMECDTITSIEPINKRLQKILLVILFQTLHNEFYSFPTHSKKLYCFLFT